MKNLTWQNPEQLFVAQELINKVKSKCCGIKVKLNVDEENHIVNPIPNDALMQKLIERGFKNDVVLTQNLRDSSSLNVNRNCICVFKKHNSAQRIFRDDS